MISKLKHLPVFCLQFLSAVAPWSRPIIQTSDKRVNKRYMIVKWRSRITKHSNSIILARLSLQQYCFTASMFNLHVCYRHQIKKRPDNQPTWHRLYTNHPGSVYTDKTSATISLQAQNDSVNDYSIFSRGGLVQRIMVSGDR